MKRKTMTSLIKTGNDFLTKLEYDKAARFFKNALSQAPAPLLEIQYQLAFCFEMLGFLERAKKSYASILRETPNPALCAKIHFRKGLIAIQQKKHTYALKDFHRAAHIFSILPGNQGDLSQAHYFIALCHEANGEIIKALQILSKLEKDAELNLDVCYREIVCYDKLGRYDEVRKYCGIFMDLYSQTPETEHHQTLYRDVASIQKQLNSLFMVIDS